MERKLVCANDPLQKGWYIAHYHDGVSDTVEVAYWNGKRWPFDYSVKSHYGPFHTFADGVTFKKRHGSGIYESGTLEA